jgi:large subunit ribosomal protein L22
MKRIRPAPMGRAYRYQRRLTHIVLSVAERDGGQHLVTKVGEPEKAAKPTAKKTAAKKTAAKKSVAAKKPAAATKKKASKKA